MAQCVTCGASLKQGSTRCLKCGSAIEVAPPELQRGQNTGNADLQQPQVVYVQQQPAQAHHEVAVSSKSKVAAGVLAILLGGIGIHKFYLNEPWMGLLYLVFCWTYIPAIIALIEGVLLLIMDDKKFNKKFGHL